MTNFVLVIASAFVPRWFDRRGSFIPPRLPLTTEELLKLLEFASKVVRSGSDFAREWSIYALELRIELTVTLRKTITERAAKAALSASMQRGPFD
jgi:hypothetical protein